MIANPAPLGDGVTRRLSPREWIANILAEWCRAGDDVDQNSFWAEAMKEADRD